MKKFNNLYSRFKARNRRKLIAKTLQKYATSMNRQTSISDDDIYPAYCYMAGNDNKIFRHFRRDEIYNKVLEHVTQEQGEEYLAVINKNEENKFSDADWSEFSKNDGYGDPRMFSYVLNDKTCSISPTTLRYAKVLNDIIKLFDIDKIKSAAEIGIGYAGQCRILTSYININSYSLYDLPEVLCLAKKYLSGFGSTEKINFIDGTNITVEREYDFAISNYAFSELIRVVQDIYLEKVILKSKAGYITWNPESCDRLDGYSVEELLNIIPGSSVIPEEPLTAKKNCIIIWGNK